MTPPAFDQHQIARSGSPSSRCLSIGRPAVSSRPGRAATLNHTQHQRLAHTERGKLVGMCAPTLGVAKTGRRFAGLGCLDLLPTDAGFGPRPFPALSHIDGIGLGGNRTLASNLIHKSADHSLNYRAKPLKRHSSAPAVYAPKRRCGASHCAEQISQGRGNV